MYKPCISTCSRSFSSTMGTETLSLVRLSTHTPKWPGSVPGSICDDGDGGEGQAWAGCPPCHPPPSARLPLWPPPPLLLVLSCTAARSAGLWRSPDGRWQGVPV